MKQILKMLMAGLMLSSFTVGIANAAGHGSGEMKKDEMHKDEMKKDEMKKDEMKKDEMKKDNM